MFFTFDSFCPILNRAREKDAIERGREKVERWNEKKPCSKTDGRLMMMTQRQWTPEGVGSSEDAGM